MLRPWDLQISINSRSKQAAYLQIADAIIQAIKAGKLKSGDALPGSRQLAEKLNVNRNTIIEAIDVLLAEGWLVARERKGTFVADKLALTKELKKDLSKPVQFSAIKKPAVIFDDGLPDSRLAPIAELAGAYRQIFNQKGRWQLMGYSQPAGDPDFRNAIAQMLNYKRGMKLSSDEVFITRGSQMAMYLTAHCLIESGDHVVVENPGYKPAWKAFENAGANLLPVSVDQDGFVLDELKTYLRSRKKIKALYTTPHHQFPTTVTLSLQRRLELTKLSNQYGFTIIEDDYDHEFHFGQRPILPVSSLENIERYVYIGTMSKIVAPALRVGYLASSRSFIDKVSELRRIIDVQGDNMMTQAILQLINDGHIRRHLKRATLAYKNKRDAFEEMLHEQLRDKISFNKPEGGLAFWITPDKKTDLVKVQKTLLQQGVQIMSPDDYSFDKPVNGLRLGYASLSEAQAKEGIKKLSKLL